MKYTILIVLAIQAFSCGPTRHLNIGSTSYPALPDTAECVILGVHDPGPVAAERIGSFTDTGSIWSDHQYVDSLRFMARGHGANLVKVTAHAYNRATPHSSYGYTTVIFYRVADPRRYEKVIDWSDSRKLSFADFKGQAMSEGAVPDDVRLSSGDRASRVWFIIYRINGDHFFNLAYATKTQFSCLQSRIDSGAAEADRFLLHAQGNFDLCELYRRQLENYIGRYTMRALSCHQLLENIVRQVYHSYREKKAQYDKDTDNGLDPARQQIWSRRIAAQLKNTGMSEDAFFAVPEVFTQKGQDSLARIKQPAPDLAEVYIIRPRSISTPFLKRVVQAPWVLILGFPFYFVNPSAYSIRYDSQATGVIRGRRFGLVEVDPGEHSFTSVANITDTSRSVFGGRIKKGETVDLALPAGGICYLEMDTGMYGRSRLEEISEEKGRQLLQKCKFSEARPGGWFFPWVYNPLY